MQPIRTIYRDKNVSTSILGIPLRWNDVIDRKLLIHPSDDFNSDFEIPRALKFNNTDVVINMNMNFIES